MAMTRSMRLSLLLLLSACGFASPSPIVDHYVDTVLVSSLQSELRYAGLEPAPLPSFESESKEKVGFLTVHRRAKYEGGQMSGLSRLLRLTPCGEPFYTYGNSTFACLLTLPNVTFLYRGDVKYGKLPSVGLTARADLNRTVLLLEATSNPWLGTVRVHRLSVQHLGTFAPQFFGLGPLNKSLSSLSKEFSARLASEFFSVFHGRYVATVSRAFAQVRMPRWK